MNKTQDQSIRARALDPTRSFIVQAPAGSGKTEILTQRYLALLSHAEKAPEEIIAITFTKKSAAEMRARILQALEFAQEKEPDKNHYRYTTWQLAKAVLKRDGKYHWRMMENPNRLRIVTIDSLAAFLCHHIPILTQFGATPVICDNATALYELASERTLTHALCDAAYQFHITQLLLHLDNNAEKLQILFSHLLSRREQWLPHIFKAQAQHNVLRATLENSLKNIVLEKLQLAILHLPSTLKQTLVMLAQHAGNYFLENNIANSIAGCANFAITAHPDLSQLPAWRGLTDLLLTQDGAWRKTVDVRNGFVAKDTQKSFMLATLTELTHYEAFRESLSDIQTLPPTLYSDSHWNTVTALTHLLPLLAAQLLLVFQEKKQIDFVELNLAALRALGTTDSPTDLALYLDCQIRHILIDEFQDTSVMHFHLLEKMIAGWQAHDGKTLFLVGDPMQSIYRFRHAEVGLFLRVLQNKMGHIQLEPLTLSTNFRSQKNLVDWFNQVFRAIFPAVSDIPTGRVPYTPVVAARDTTEHTAAFYPLVSSNDIDEAKKITEIIHFIRKKNPEDTLAILARSRTQLGELMTALRDAQLPVQAIEIESLAEQSEIQDLLSLSLALLHRANRVAWLAILRAPFCGLLLADLEKVARHTEHHTIWEALLSAENITGLSEDGLQRVQNLRYHLKNALQNKGNLTISAWIERAWIALGGPACLSDHNQLAHVNVYFALLESLEKQNELSMDYLKKQCETLFADNTSHKKNPIQILTIHKSKGLEFDHVFLPGLHRTPARDEEKLFQWLERINAFGGNDLIIAPIKSSVEKSNAIYDYLKKIEQEKQTHEMTRLFYVAATRAKKSLHLFAQIEYDEKKKLFNTPKNGSFLKKLWPLYENTIAIDIPPSCDVPEKNNLEKPLLLTRHTSSWFKPIASSSATAQSVFIDITLHSQQARVIGAVIHEIFQQMAQKIEVSEKQYRARLLFLGILPDEIETATDMVRTAITNMKQDPRGQWILSSHAEAHCEWPITYYKNDAYQQLIIDRSFIDKNNIRWIIDYKTTQPAEHEPLDIFLAKQKNEYIEKLHLYAEALCALENKSIQIGLYFPLCCAWIEWRYISENVTQPTHCV